MKIEKISTTQIVCNEWNPNKMNDSQQRALNESLEEFGDILPLVVRKVEDNCYQIIDGQHRFESLQNSPEIDCVVIDVSETQAMRLTQILNRTRGEDDPEKLLHLLENLSSQISIEELIHGMPISSEAEFDELLSGLQAGSPQDGGDFGGGLTDDDGIPDDEEVETRVKRGDIWELGRHRIMCGDSTVAEDVAALMDGKKAIAVLTDPPYGISQQGILNDEPEKLNLLIELSVENLPIENGVIVAFASTRTFPVWLDTTRQKKIKFERMLWLYKEAQCTFPWRGWILTSESILVSTIGNPMWNEVKPYHHDCYKLSEVSKELPEHIGWHGSVKPMSVLVDIIQRISTTASLVYDCFLGSGSTLIAAEKTDRICYGMELSERYCDVIIKRWEDYTGDVAIKL